MIYLLRKAIKMSLGEYLIASLFDLILYISVNIFSAMSGRVFLG